VAIDGSFIVTWQMPVDNATESGEPFTTEPMRADLMDAFETLNILTSALGFPVVEARPKAEGAEVFHVSR
jgi:hypothetical protein